MTLLTTLQHPRYAQALVDYLNTQGIPAQLRESGHTIAIFVLDDAVLPQAQLELARFLADPDHERYRQASWERDEVPADTSNLSRVYRAPSLLQNIRQTGIVTKAVFVLCVLVYLYTGEGMNAATRAQLLFFPDLAAMADSQEYWRWLTPALLHFGLVHLGFNLFSWWIFAGIIERAQTSARLLGITLTCALVGNWLEFFWSRDNFGGLSGVVYGLLGYLWFYGRFNPRAPMALPSGMVVFMLVMLGFGFTNILPIANMAHLGGLLSGCLLGFALARLDMADDR